ncbi:MAG TPA: hypothetical protein VKZ59_07270 [Acidobacteriota bacterium]|nr:hypothetical protein [Acidobacteriota bacterium]
MRIIQYVSAFFLGGMLSVVALLSLVALGPGWENNPTLGPFLVAVSITVASWVLLFLIRRHTDLMPSSGKYVMLATTCLTWAAIYVWRKAPDDPPIFVLLGLVIWIPALLIYYWPEGLWRNRLRLH